MGRLMGLWLGGGEDDGGGGGGARGGWGATQIKSCSLLKL